ncbi:MAG: GlxA family transcriptional regulator [Rhodanobacter sp.]|nr:MAG: GlxA family transcriptional regulator [Rhodanobacter sp.]TAL89103.1 MAG: GlxA family transcriptional regulator [Rhodanobacter sp.]TAM39569.1 MAG: GlxA family transcriptional regulator [Rhodanobacter sp.]
MKQSRINGQDTPATTRGGRPDSPLRYGFLLVPGFTLIGFASATEPLRMVNRCDHGVRYHWHTISVDGQLTRSSNGVAVQPDFSMADTPQLDALFVCGSNPIPPRIERAHLHWLRDMAHRGTALGGICTGSFWLAKAGLLDGYRCTLHWEDASRFLADFPKIAVSTRLYEIDRDRYTCSGGIAPVDMMLNLIRRQADGDELAAMAAELMVCERIRSTGDTQRVPLRQRIGTGQPKLIEAAALIESNLEEPLSVDELARHVNLSARQLERLFNEYLQCTPGAYCLELRLARARQLMLGTGEAIINIAAACGFASVAHFTRRYREQFGIPPGAERRAMNARPG